MNLTGRLVQFWLTPSGLEALSGTSLGNANFQALVLSEDALGVWIWVTESSEASVNVILLKWEYFATVGFEYQPEVVAERPKPGFKP